MWENILKDDNGRFILNQEQTMGFFKVNERTLRTWRRGGKIKFEKIARGIYYYIIDPKKVS